MVLLSMPTKKLDAQSPCPPVSGITLSSVTEHTAEITWTAGGSENYWFYCFTTDFTTPAPAPANEGWMHTLLLMVVVTDFGSGPDAVREMSVLPNPLSFGRSAKR